MRHRLTKRDIFTIPNALSLFRILLIPLIVWLYVAREQRYAAVGLVALSGLTDIADGYIARHFNMVSDVGKILDPIADKLTQAAILLCLASRYPVIYWVLAVVFMVLLFAMKSLSVVIFCGVLYAASGILFPLPLAITINLIGTGVMAAVPYVLGRHMGNASLEQMVSTHKNAAILQHLRMENTFLYTMLIRIINILPFDIMSAYFGATRTRFVPYLLGSILGMISSCVLFPILGTNITDPRSPRFLISAAIELVIMAASFLLLVYVRRKAAAEEETA